MGRAKGTQKTGGRAKGTPNKRALVLKDVLDDLEINVVERIRDLMPRLPEEKQAQVLLELLSYLYPKRKAIEKSGDRGGPIQIESLDPKIRQARIEELLEKRQLLRKLTD